MGIQHQIKPRFRSRNEAIIANLRANAGAGPPIDPYMAIKKKTAELSYAMALLHGGDWRVLIDHEAGLVLVRRN